MRVCVLRPVPAGFRSGPWGNEGVRWGARRRGMPWCAFFFSVGWGCCEMPHRRARFAGVALASYSFASTSREASSESYKGLEPGDEAFSRPGRESEALGRHRQRTRPSLPRSAVPVTAAHRQPTKSLGSRVLLPNAVVLPLRRRPSKRAFIEVRGGCLPPARHLQDACRGGGKAGRVVSAGFAAGGMVVASVMFLEMPYQGRSCSDIGGLTLDCVVSWVPWR